MTRGTPSWAEFEPAAIGVARAIGAIIIALVFVSVLMTASAQQEVLKRLTAIDPKLDYSSAYVIKLRVDQADADARTAAANEQAAGRASDRDAEAYDTARVTFEDDWDSALPSLRALARRGKCDLDQASVETADDAKRSDAIAGIENCPDAGSLGKTPNPLLISYQAMVAARATTSVAQQHFLRAQAVSKAVKADDLQASHIRDSFDATSKLRSSWYLGGDLLLDFPPVLLQIILSFVSGTFGALLLTLVLIVYPNNQFTIASSGGYGARTLLGGLIALCVYVVLNGGSSVLGTPASSQASTNNYMTFCAIGILAGMFADRVAAWLSARADTFFRAKPT